MLALSLFYNFFIIGCFSFGGGYSMLGIIEHKVTDEGWMTPSNYLESVSLASVLPGSIGLNISLIVGYKTAGILGATVSGIAILLPSLLFVLMLSKFIKRFQDNSYVRRIFYFLKPVIVGLIFFSAYKFIVSNELISELTFKSFFFCVFTVLSIVTLSKTRISPVYIIVIAGICGYIFI